MISGFLSAKYEKQSKCEENDEKRVNNKETDRNV
jgi:hypothetical protein